MRELPGDDDAAVGIALSLALSTERSRAHIAHRAAATSGSGGGEAVAEEVAAGEATTSDCGVPPATLAGTCFAPDAADD